MNSAATQQTAIMKCKEDKMCSDRSVSDVASSSLHK